MWKNILRDVINAREGIDKLSNMPSSILMWPLSPCNFISMDLIREFHPPTSRRHRYALTIICMLTGYVFCIPLQPKTAEEFIQAYIDQVYSRFGGSLKILSNNGTEFKNKLFEQVAKELGVEYKLYTPLIIQHQMAELKDFMHFLKLV